jgi:hypothetical protein
MDFAVRYDFLKTTIARYDAYFNLAAVKASLLLTSNAIFLAPALGQKGEVFAVGNGAAHALLILAAVLSLVSIVFAALVMASWLGRMRPQSLMFSDTVAATAPADYARSVAALDEVRALADMSQLAHLLATGITRKFRYVNLSLATLVAAVVCGALALLV